MMIAEDFEMIEPQNLIEPLVPNISFELSEMPQTTADCRSRYQTPFSLWQEAAVRLAASCRCGRCGGPRRWSFSAGARAGPPVARSARHASMLLALPDRGSPWEPSRDCLPDEIADERVADGARVGGSVAGFTVKK